MELNFKEVAGGVADLIRAGASYEAAKNGSFSSGGDAVLATTYAPEVDAQNRGAPNSFGTQQVQKPLVGDETKTGIAVDRKWLMIGGGVMLTMVAVLALKK